MIEQVEEILLTLDDKLTKTLNVLKDDYAGIRAGRANPHILDKVNVDYYGAPTPISQTSNISVQEGRCLVVAPWDASLLKNIEKAILVSPQLTEERRKELSKQVRKMGEDAKVAQRNVRREAMEALKKLKNDKVISEDESDAAEKDIEKYVSDGMAKIDEAVAAKDKEIMTV